MITDNLKFRRRKTESPQLHVGGLLVRHGRTKFIFTAIKDDKKIMTDGAVKYGGRRAITIADKKYDILLKGE